MSQFFPSGGQSIRVSASTSVLPMNTQDWSPLGWTGWISWQSKGLSRVFSNTTVQKASILWHSAFLTVQLSHAYMTTGKTIAFTFSFSYFLSNFLDLLRYHFAFLKTSKYIQLETLLIISRIYIINRIFAILDVFNNHFKKIRPTLCQGLKRES